MHGNSKSFLGQLCVVEWHDGELGLQAFGGGSSATHS